jgi:lipopolysaccharide transport protein LptA
VNCAPRVCGLAAAALAVVPGFALAFDSAEWLEKREVLSREAERLQAAYADCVARLEVPAENVSFPIEGHPDGSVKSILTAEKAQFFLDTGFVWGKNVVVRQMTTNGVVEAEITADSCVVDRSTKSGWVEGHAHAKYLKNEVEGDGIYFSFSEEFVIISANTLIRSKEQKFDTSVLGSAKSAKKKAKGGAGSAQVVACRTDLDRKAGVIMFDGNVHVSDPEYALGAERLFVFLDGTNSLKRIVADGDVAVTNGLRYGSCARATYSKSAGKVVMYADETRPAKLVEESHKRDEVEGRRITFWLDSDQIEVEGSTITVDGGAFGGKDGALKLMGK